MHNLSTNENILFQVAFKEACEFTRQDKNKGKKLLELSLELYDNVLIKGLNMLSERKNCSLDQHKEAISKLKSLEELKNYHNSNSIALKNLSKNDSETLKQFIKQKQFK